MPAVRHGVRSLERILGTGRVRVRPGGSDCFSVGQRCSTDESAPRTAAERSRLWGHPRWQRVQRLRGGHFASEGRRACRGKHQVHGEKRAQSSIIPERVTFSQSCYDCYKFFSHIFHSRVCHKLFLLPSRLPCIDMTATGIVASTHWFSCGESLVCGILSNVMVLVKFSPLYIPTLHTDDNDFQSFRRKKR